jgi:phosphate butyryltransferase
MSHGPISSYDQLITQAVAIANEGRRKTVAVAAAQDADVIDAVSQAQADGFIEGILIGDAEKIRALAEQNGANLAHLKIVDEPDVDRAAHAAVRLAADKEADVIMKGFLPTSSILKVVLDKQYGFRGPNTLSHCAVLDIPGYHKLLNFTDGGMVVKPTPAQKLEIIDNAVLISRAMGISPVKVALSVVNTPELMVDALRKTGGMLIEGPLSFELATSRDAAEKYGLRSDTVGDTDVYVVDSIEECNVVAKSLINFADAVFAGVIVGAKVPVSLVSRTDTVRNKKASLAIACLIADYYAQNRIWEN